VEGSCEHGDEPSGSTKCWDVPEWLHNWQLLKKGSAPQVRKYENLKTTFTLLQSTLGKDSSVKKLDF
jgi:hypothetical protein